MVRFLFNLSTLSARGPMLDVRILHRRQILISEVIPRTGRLKYLAVDP